MAHMKAGRKVLYASGSFKDDPTLAAQTAAKGLVRFCEQTNQPVPALDQAPELVRRILPRRLR